MHKSTQCARALLLGLYACGDDSDEKSPIQSSDAAARDTGTIGASDTPNPAGEVSVRGVRYCEILIGRVWLRVDLGLNLKGVAATDRLEASGSFNAMVSHRVRLESDAQVDPQLRTWLETAYNASG